MLDAVARKLKAPPRRRLELIEELGADAEALQEELERRGYDARTARRIAVGRVAPSGEVLAELEARHAPRLGRWARKAGVATGIERMGAAMTAVLAGASLLAVLWQQDPGVASGLLGWSLVGVVALLSSNWVRAAKGLWIDGDLPAEQRRTLWERQVGLILAAVSLGGLGAAWQVYSVLGAVEASSGEIWAAVQRGVFFGVLGVGAAAFGLLGWLALLPRLVTDEACERRIAMLVTLPFRFAGKRADARRQ